MADSIAFCLAQNVRLLPGFSASRSAERDAGLPPDIHAEAAADSSCFTQRTYRTYVVQLSYSHSELISCWLGNIFRYCATRGDVPRFAVAPCGRAWCQII